MKESPEQSSLPIIERIRIHEGLQAHGFTTTVNVDEYLLKLKPDLPYFLAAYRRLEAYKNHPVTKDEVATWMDPEVEEVKTVLGLIAPERIRSGEHTGDYAVDWPQVSESSKSLLFWRRERRVISIRFYSGPAKNSDDATRSALARIVAEVHREKPKIDFSPDNLSVQVTTWRGQEYDAYMNGFRLFERQPFSHPQLAREAAERRLILLQKIYQGNEPTDK